MLPLGEISPALSIEELEAQINHRSVAIALINNEKAKIHAIWQSKVQAKHQDDLAKSDPSLAQTVGFPSIKMGV